MPKALQNTAFVYDNALAAMAFLACGQVDRARSIGEALISAGKEIDIILTADFVTHIDQDMSMKRLRSQDGGMTAQKAG